MWPSATCSEGRRALGAACAAVLVWAGVGPASAVVLESQDEALAAAFPEARIESRTAFLDDDQAERIEALAGSAPTSRVVTYYVASRDGTLQGTAYFDAHRVRTLPEVLMVVVAPAGTVERVAILSFQEPRDYLPRGRWLEQFHGKKLDGRLSIQQDIRAITGATLSSRAATAAVRRVLALHQVLGETAGAPDAGGAEERPEEEP